KDVCTRSQHLHYTALATTADIVRTARRLEPIGKWCRRRGRGQHFGNRMSRRNPSQYGLMRFLSLVAILEERHTRGHRVGRVVREVARDDLYDVRRRCLLCAIRQRD